VIQQQVNAFLFDISRSPVSQGFPVLNLATEIKWQAADAEFSD
jgi:hypothetical protein